MKPLRKLCRSVIRGHSKSLFLFARKGSKDAEGYFGVNSMTSLIINCLFLSKYIIYISPSSKTGNPLADFDRRPSTQALHGGSIG